MLSGVKEGSIRHGVRRINWPKAELDDPEMLKNYKHFEFG
jgi:hypothetical protein